MIGKGLDQKEDADTEDEDPDNIEESDGDEFDQEIGWVLFNFESRQLTLSSLCRMCSKLMICFFFENTCQNFT